MVLSYNAKPFLQKCLVSIQKYTSGIDYEIIVVDNNSSDETAKWLITLKNPKIKVILSKINLGFCGGNNLALKEARGKYILLLNPDTLLLENTLKIMFEWMEKHPQVGVSSCTLLDSDKKLMATGGYFPTLGRLLMWALFLDDLPGISGVIKSYHPKPYRYKDEFYPDWVTGAFFLVRRTAIDQVGMMDEKIFLYADELEWSIRFKKAKWKIAYTPITHIVHLERKSSAGVPTNAILGEIRGLRYIYSKHYPGAKQVGANLILNLMALLRIGLWLVRGKSQIAKVYLKAIA